MAKPASPLVHRSAAAAWAHFRDKCGVEPLGRDADFVEQLREELDKGAPDLDAAMAGASNDTLVRAIFNCAAPFVAMSRDILAFFSRAGARYGQGQWSLTIEDVPFELRDFADFIAATQRAWGAFDLPALTIDEAWPLLHTLLRSQGPDSPRETCPVEPAPDVVDWQAAFQTYGRYNPWPPSLAKVRLPRELHETADVVGAVLDRLRASGLDLAALRAGVGRATQALSIYDEAALPFLENDHWTRNMLLAINEVARVEGDELTALGGALTAFFAGLPRILVPGEVDIESLEQILSLPVWKRRHEVYAVWIATRIVDALPEHTEILHDNGALAFPFKKTKVATVAGRETQVTLYGERKQPLARPIGAGRKNNAQPDFSLWIDGEDLSRCLLVIEVKHYAISTSRKFSEVLIDYARAHPDAQVVLVNYGPTSDMLGQLDDPDASVSHRCHHIGNLTPFDHAAQSQLAAFARSVIDQISFGRHLLIDISGSMKELLHSDDFRDWLLGPANRSKDQVTLADHRRIWDGPLDEAHARIFAHDQWTAEQLVPIAHELLVELPEILVVTDDAGIRELEAGEGLVVELEPALGDLRFCNVRVRQESDR